MKLRIFLLTIFTVVFLVSSNFAQVNPKTGITPSTKGISLVSCESATGWKTGAGTAMKSTIAIKANTDDPIAGNGCIEVKVVHPAPDVVNGNWTDAQYKFAKPIDIGDATDIRFWIKVKTPTKGGHTLQFTCDLYDSTATAPTTQLFRWAEDRDIFYGTSSGGSGSNSVWHEVVIPISRLDIPSWNGVGRAINKKMITTFGFGIHTNYKADSITILLDDVRVTKSVTVGTISKMDNGSATVWTTFNNNVALNTVVTKTNTDETADQSLSGSTDVTFRMLTAPASWGSVAMATNNFAATVDVTGARELRFFMQLVKGTKQIAFADSGVTIPSTATWYNNLIGFVDVLDEDAQAELWRYINGGAMNFMTNEIMHQKMVRPTDGSAANFKTPKWCEYVLPLQDFDQASWMSHINPNGINLKKISGFAFGVGHVAFTNDVKTWGACRPDTVQVRLNSFYATTDGDVKTAVEGGQSLPTTMTLENNYPNPFNPTTTIRFTVPQTGYVNLKVYDIAGREVRSVVENAYKLRGSYEFKVDMSNLASGVYYYRLEQGAQSITKKMMLLK